MLASPLPPFFLTHTVWDVRVYGSSLVFLFSGPFVGVLPSILRGGAGEVSIPLMRFLLRSLVLSCFLVLLGIFFLIFFRFRIFWCLLPISPKYLYISFSLSHLIFSLFGSSIPSVICCFLLFIIRMAHFSMPYSIPISSLPVLGLLIISHF